MISIGCKFSIIVNARRNCFVHRRMVHHRLVINAELVCVEHKGLTVVMRASNGRLFYGQSSDYALTPKRCLPLQRQTMWEFYVVVTAMNATNAQSVTITKRV